MARYIDINEIKFTGAVFEDRDGEIYIKLSDVKQSIEQTPTADVVEVKHGEWKQGVPYVCSICGKPAPDEKNTSEKYSCWTSPYCPHCGADMRGESNVKE